METINYKLITEVGDIIVPSKFLRKFIYSWKKGKKLNDSSNY